MDSDWLDPDVEFPGDDVSRDASFVAYAEECVRRGRTVPAGIVNRDRCMRRNWTLSSRSRTCTLKSPWQGSWKRESNRGPARGIVKRMARAEKGATATGRWLG